MKIKFTQWPYGARCAFTTSWDDGFATDMKVLEALEKQHVRGTFFISSKFIGEIGYLDLQQIRDIIKKGHEIGSHTQTHAMLTKMDTKHVLSELINSKKNLEELINKEIFGFSYPFSRFDERIKALVKLANYKYARTGIFGTINSHPQDWFEWNPSMVAQGRGGYHKKFFLKHLRFVSPWIIARGFPKDWVETAHYMFKIAYIKGGLLHLWGHSGQLCEDDIKRLKKFLLRVSNFPDVWCARNIDIFRYEMTKKSTLIRVNKVMSKKTEITIGIKPKIEPTVITVEVENPDRSITFRSDHMSIQKHYQGKKLLITFIPMCEKIIE